MRYIQVCNPVDWGIPYTTSVWVGQEDLSTPDGRNFDEAEDIESQLIKLGYRKLDTHIIIVGEPNA